MYIVFEEKLLVYKFCSVYKINGKKTTHKIITVANLGRECVSIKIKM